MLELVCSVLACGPKNHQDAMGEILKEIRKGIPARLCHKAGESRLQLSSLCY